MTRAQEESRVERGPTLQAFVKAAQYGFDGGHTARVTQLSQALVHALELDPWQTHVLRLGALLHDVGKAELPPCILLKAGPLEPGEFALVQTHPVRGEAALKRLGTLPDAVLSIVRHHHERWDGGGYPDGLRGPAIPFLARLLSVVDVYDALVSERPYKTAWTKEAALAELRRGASRQFDPKLVTRFCKFMGTASVAGGLPQTKVRPLREDNPEGTHLQSIDKW